MEKLGHINLVESGSYDYVSSDFNASSEPFLSLRVCAEDVVDLYGRNESIAVFIPTVDIPCLWEMDEEECEWLTHSHGGCFFPIDSTAIERWVEFLNKAGFKMEYGSPHPELGERVIIPPYEHYKGQLAALTALRYVFSPRYSDIPPIAYTLNRLGFTEEAALLWASSWVFRSESSNYYDDGLIQQNHTPKRDVISKFYKDAENNIQNTCGENDEIFLNSLGELKGGSPSRLLYVSYSEFSDKVQEFLKEKNKAKKRIREMVEEDIEGFIKKLNIKDND